MSFLTFSSYLQALGKTFPADYPGMITSDRYLFAQPFKKYVFLQDADRCLYTVIYFFQVFQSCTKSLADGLMSQAITIRTFVSRNNELWFQAGGGIVARSQDEYELQEVNNKLGALKKAIDLAVNLKN